MSSPTDPQIQRQRAAEKLKADLSLAGADIKRAPEGQENPQQSNAPAKPPAEQLAGTSFQYGVERRQPVEKIEGRLERLNKVPKLSAEPGAKTQAPKVVIAVHEHYQPVDVLQRLMNWIENMLKRLDRAIFSRKKGTNEVKAPLITQPLRKKKTNAISTKGQGANEDESAAEELTVDKQAHSPELEEWLEQQNPDKAGANTTKRG